MAHLYSHKWTSTYGLEATKVIDGVDRLTAAAETWATGLRGITGEQMANGLHACIDRGDAWPPSLPEFKSLCLGKAHGKNEFGLDYIPEYHRSFPVTDKSKLISNGQRDARRARGRVNIRSILNAVKGVKNDID